MWLTKASDSPLLSVQCQLGASGRVQPHQSAMSSDHVLADLSITRSITSTIFSITVFASRLSVLLSSSSFAIFTVEGRRPQNDSSVLSSSSCLLLLACTPPESC